MAETSGMKWYVLRAVSGKEGKVKEYIDAAKKHNDVLGTHVGEVLLPTEKYAMLRNGKRVIKEKLFLPGYVLVQACLQGEVAHMLRFIPNVLGFLGGLDNPQEVKQSDINRILGTAEETTIESAELNIPYSVDETVKVTDGPFSGFSGIIEEVNTEKHKLKVMYREAQAEGNGEDLRSQDSAGVVFYTGRERIGHLLRNARSI